MARIVLAILVLATLVSCTNLFFFPMKHHVLTPSDIGLAYEDLYIRGASGQVLHAWVLKSEHRSGCPPILFLHGNAENISTHLASVYWLPSFGFDVYLLDYAGYGLSTGSPTVAELVQDVDVALSAVLHDQGRESKVILLGQSLGGAIAIYSAAHSQHRNALAAVVSEGAFSSYQTIASEKINDLSLLSPFSYPLSFLFLSSYDPVEAADMIAPIPLLLVHGLSDTIVPPSHGQTLFEQARYPKEYWPIEGVGHIAAFRERSNQERLVNYLKQVTGCAEGKP